MFLIQLTAEVQAPDWTTIIVQSLITIATIIGGAGFWEWKKAKLAAKREDKKEEKDYDQKFDNLTKQMTHMNSTVDSVSADMQDVKHDIALLQQANEATVKYRELRDIRDKEAIEVQNAVIESITGLMRDRLLDNYRRCIKKGYYSMEEREIYGKMFDCYENPPFNGDGVMHDLRPLMKKLPLVAEDAGKLNDDDSDD